MACKMLLKKSQYLFILMTIALAACEPAPSVQSGKFSSMQRCLAALQKSTGMKLDIVRDNPEIVSGYLGNTKRDFGCQKKSTGSIGTYIEGWYEE